MGKTDSESLYSIIAPKIDAQSESATDDRMKDSLAGVEGG